MLVIDYKYTSVYITLNSDQSNPIYREIYSLFRRFNSSFKEKRNAKLFLLFVN